MEIVKDLPEVFEEFAEQRKNSFLEIKKLKDEDKFVIGSYCTYFPREIALAMGAISVGLCSFTDEVIPDAEKDLPSNLCPLIKASYGFAITDKCPYFYFSDLIVGETTCDGKKKMYEYLSEVKDIFLMELPNSQRDVSLALWKSEIIRFKKYLENKFSVSINDNDILNAIKSENKVRTSLQGFYEIMKNDPAPMSGLELFNVLYGSGFKFDRSKIPEEIDALKNKIMEEYKKNPPKEKRPRILFTGCPVGGSTIKVINAIEDNGGVIVAYENCTGAKNIDRLVSEEGDVYDAIAERYLNIGCSVMTPNKNRFELLGRLIDEYKVDGVVEMTLQACHTYNIETKSIKDFVTKEKKIPYIHVETNYSNSDAGQLSTRISAFLEMLG